MAFLLSAQAEDGHWSDFRHRFPFDDVTIASDAWATAWVGRALVAAGGPADAVRRAASWLLGRRRDYGWGFCARTPPDADSTAIVVLLLAEGHAAGVISPPPPALAKDLLAYWHPFEDGFRTYRPHADGAGLLRDGLSWAGVHPCVTPVAALALERLHPPAPEAVVVAARSRVRRDQAGDGSWPAFWWTGRAYATAAAVELLDPGEDAEAVERAAGWARAAQRPDGGWGDDLGGESCAFYTALALTVLARTGRTSDDPPMRAGLDWLARNQLADGSWPAAPILRDPRPDVHEPWKDPHESLLLPPMADANRLFCTATALRAVSPRQ